MEMVFLPSFSAPMTVSIRHCPCKGLYWFEAKNLLQKLPSHTHGWNNLLGRNAMTTNSAPARPSLKHPGVLLATWFGAGYLPKVPGTWGSAAALPFAWLLLDTGGMSLLLISAVAVFFVGIWAANDYSRRSGIHDPGPVVIDEVAGQWLVLAAVPMSFSWFLIGFGLFRLFDILKPWPVSVMDREIKGGLGVMLDDIGAAMYALGIVFALKWGLETAGWQL